MHSFPSLVRPAARPVPDLSPFSPRPTGKPSHAPNPAPHLVTLGLHPPRHGVLAFGDDRIDAHLPGGGVALGGLHEIGGAGLDRETGALPAGFAAALAARIGTDKPVFWIAPSADLYPPGMGSFGLDPARLVLVHPKDSDATLGAMETALREGGAGVVVGEVEALDRVASRRLALAAQRHGTTCLALRRWPHGHRGSERDTSLAATRWQTSPAPSDREGREPGAARWLLALTQARGGRPGEWIVQAGESEDATHPVRVVARLADPEAAAESLAG